MMCVHDNSKNIFNTPTVCCIRGALFAAKQRAPFPGEAPAHIPSSICTFFTASAAALEDSCCEGLAGRWRLVKASHTESQIPKHPSELRTCMFKHIQGTRICSSRSSGIWPGAVVRIPSLRVSHDLGSMVDLDMLTYRY